MSSNHLNPSTGVKNLRALFENKPGDLSTSPPDRGQSPANSDLSSHSRPVSKVRASFVAVDGRSDLNKGLQSGSKKTSDQPMMEETKLNGPSVTPAKTSKDSGQGAPTETRETSGEAVPGHARHITNTSVEGGLGSILKGSSFDGTQGGTKTTSAEDKEAGVSGEQSTAITNGGKGSGSPRMPIGSLVTRGHKAAERSFLPHERHPQLSTVAITGNTQPKTVSEVKAKLQPKSPQTTKSPKPSTIPSSAASLKSSPKLSTSGFPKPSTSQATKQSPKLTTNGIKVKTSDSDTTSAAAATSAPAEKSTKSQQNGATAKINGGSFKPATTLPQSKPVSLPERKPITTRAPRSSLAPSSSATASASSTTFKRVPRASLPVQSKINSSDRSTSQTSAAAPAKSPSGDFLARLTRPTASTAQKIHDKIVPRSPPRAKKEATAPPPAVRPRHDRRSSISTGTQTEEDRENDRSTRSEDPRQADQQPNKVGKDVATPVVQEHTTGLGIVARDAT